MLSSTVHVNPNFNSVNSLEKEINNITYILDEPIPTVTSRNSSIKSVAFEDKVLFPSQSMSNIAAESSIGHDRLGRSEYIPPYSLAGLPTRSQFHTNETVRDSNVSGQGEHSSVPLNNNALIRRIPEMYDPYLSTVSASFVVGPRKLIRDWKLKIS